MQLDIDFSSRHRQRSEALETKPVLDMAAWTKIRRRVGRFKLQAELLHYQTEIVQRIMAQVIVLRCEHLYNNNEFEYIALSEGFEELEEGVEAPEYQFVFNSLTDEIRVQRRDPNRREEFFS